MDAPGLKQYEALSVEAAAVRRHETMWQRLHRSWSVRLRDSLEMNSICLLVEAPAACHISFTTAGATTQATWSSHRASATNVFPMPT